MRRLVISLLVLFAPPCWAEAEIAEKNCSGENAAKLVSLQGRLFYDPSSRGDWREARLEESFCEGSRIRIEPYSRASLLLPNGITLRLDEGTVLSLNGIANDKPTLLDLAKGFVHFISRTPKQLKITTPIANAGPEGTEFALNVDGDDASLWVYEGAVKFYNDQGDIRLNPGEGATAHLGQAPHTRIDIKPEDAVVWALYYPSILPYPEASAAVDGDIRTAIDDFRRGRADAALTRLDALPPEQQTPYFFKVRAAMRLTSGQADLALQDIKALQAISPNDAEALALQSVLALTQNRKDQAFDLANRAIAADPKSAAAYSALSYAEQGRFALEKALAAADQATRLAPHDALAWARKAELELATGMKSESEQSARRALALDAGLERTQTVMGFSHLLQMDTDEALQNFETAVKLDSTAPLPRLGLGLAKIRKGDIEAGRRDLEIAATLDPNNSIIRSYLGKAYFQEKRYELAKDQFDLAKQRDPKDPTPYFYDAINKQAANNPVEALQDTQKAVELNGNRGVYRSELALDKDAAARQSGMGRIYNSLGFDDVANRLAARSQSTDPGNYSAHRLLADSYAAKPRHEIARASEQLQAQLLQPLNYNPIQPRLAYTDLNIINGIGPSETSFNEYSRLYEGNATHLTATGIYGSNNTIGDETVLSGIQDKLAYSFGQLHYDTDGYRPNNDLKHNIYNAFLQYEISPALNIQTEYRHRNTSHGDLQLKGDVNDFSNKARRDLDTDSYRFGLKASPSSHSDLLFSYIYSFRDEINKTFSQTPAFPPVFGSGEFSNVDNIKNQGYQLESQYIFTQTHYNFVLGGGDYKFDVDRNTQSSLCMPNLFLHIINCPVNQLNNTAFSRNQRFGYFYGNFELYKQLTTTLGLSYDNYQDKQINNSLSLSHLSPKLGAVWKYNDLISFRLAGFQAVKSPIIVNQILQPTQVAGFNQFFDDINGTRSTQYAAGMDAKFSPSLFSGIEAYKRHLEVPLTNTIVTREEELYRLYLNWLAAKNWTANTEFRFENYKGGVSTPDSVETLYIPLTLRYFRESGIFASLGGTLVNQNVKTHVANETSFNSNFFLVDGATGYKFPKQYGMISFEAHNLLGKRFKYRDRNYQMNEQRTTDLIPERILLVRLTLNF